MQYYIGVDLAWTTSGQTGLAVINKDRRLVFCGADSYSDDFIADLIQCFSPAAAVSVDSPLIVPYKNRGRDTDSVVMKHSFGGHKLTMFATTRSFMIRSYGQIRGEVLRAKLEETPPGLRLGENLCETYPRAVTASLFPSAYPIAYKMRPATSLEQNQKAAGELSGLLADLGFHGNLPLPESVGTKKAYKNIEDQFDAILCAVNSWYWKNSAHYREFSESDDGFTIICGKHESPV